MTDQPAAEPTSSNASRWLMNLFGAGIALAIVLWFFIPLMPWQGSDPPLITKRAEWPPAVEQLLQGAELAPETIAEIEITLLDDGYVLRMPASETAVALVEDRFEPVDEAKAKEPRVVAAIAQFWDHLPHRWRSHKPRDDDRFFTNAAGDGAGAGTLDDVARVNNEDGMILIWHADRPPAK